MIETLIYSNNKAPLPWQMVDYTMPETLIHRYKTHLPWQMVGYTMTETLIHRYKTPLPWQMVGYTISHLPKEQDTITMTDDQLYYAISSHLPTQQNPFTIR